MTRNSQLDVAVDASFVFPSVSQAKAAVKALIPDNVNFPKGLSMRMFSRGSALAIKVTGRNVQVATILSTIDEVLEHVSVAQKVMSG